MGWWRWGGGGAVALAIAWLPLLGAAAGEAVPLSNAGPVLEGLAAEARDPGRSERERLQLVQTLGQWGTAQVREPLLALLGDPLPSIRAAAAGALGWPGNREAVDALVKRVEAPGEEVAVRAAALRALGRIGDPSARAGVLAATRDPDPAIREAALWAVALGPLTDPADRGALLGRLIEDEPLDLQLRAQAIQALAPLVDAAGSTQVLLRVLEHGPRSVMPLPSATADEREILALRYRQQRDLRAWAAIALGERREPAALPLLLRAAEDPDDFFLRLLAVEALNRYRVPAALPVLVRRLEDPFPGVRVSALAGLAALGDRQVVDPVLARLADQVPAVRAQAVLALAELGGSEVRPRLEALLGTEADPQVQRALEAALARLAP